MNTVTASHIWDEKGNYILRVKAKDVHGEENPWSDPLPITMPKNKATKHIHTIIGKIHGAVSNIGTDTTANL